MAMVGLGTQTAQAGAVIDNGSGVSMGIFDQGHLGFDGVGIFLAGVGDAITPGCLCEGWGVAGNGIPGWGSVDDGGISNLTVDSFVSTASTATSIVHLTSLPDLMVTQAYAPSVGAPATLFEDLVTITNTSGATITDIRYRRVMDWDVPPTEFDEFVTIGGLPAANLLFSNDNGFDTSNPLGGTGGDLAGCGTLVNFTDCGPADHGAHFDFGFGDLAAGESKSFSIFYGAARTEGDALAALGAVSAEIYSLGQSNGGEKTGAPGTFIFAFKGVGGTPFEPIPEPTSMMLLGTGLAGLLASRKRMRV